MMKTGQLTPAARVHEVNLEAFIEARREECVSRVMAGESFCSINTTVSLILSS